MTKSYFKKFLSIARKPEMKILPGQLAFFLLLSLIPLIAIIAMLATSFSFSYDGLMDLLEDNVPKEVYSFIADIVDVKNLNINVFIFYFSGFILASNGPSSMIICSNILYNFKDTSGFARRIKSLMMTLILVMLLLFIIVVPIFGDQLMNFITNISPSGISKTVTFIYNLLKYPITIFVIYFFIKLLYVLAPDMKIKSKDTTKGALFTTLGWIMFTELYSLYVTRIAIYDELYGNVSNFIILFLWIYILAYIFVFGMTLNAVSYHNKYSELENSEKSDILR